MTGATFEELTDKALQWCLEALLAPIYPHTKFTRNLQAALSAEQERRLREQHRACGEDAEPLAPVNFSLCLDDWELHQAHHAMFSSMTAYLALAEHERAKGSDCEDYLSAADFFEAIVKEISVMRRAVFAATAALAN